MKLDLLRICLIATPFDRHTGEWVSRKDYDYGTGRRKLPNKSVDAKMMATFFKDGSYHGDDVDPALANEWRKILDDAGIQYGSMLTPAGVYPPRHGLTVWGPNEDEVERAMDLLEMNGAFSSSGRPEPVLRSHELKDREDNYSKP